MIPVAQNTQFGLKPLNSRAEPAQTKQRSEQAYMLDLNWIGTTKPSVNVANTENFNL
jgi:hypothetical protein